MEYPVTGQHYSDIGQRKIIVAQPAVEENLQPFRIYKVTKPLNGRVKIYAQHLSYDLSKNVAMPFSVAASATACADALAGLKTNAVETCPFTFETDVTTNASYTQPTPATIRSRLGGVEGSILDQFGGEYEFDVYKVKFLRQRGADNGVSLRYGKNITDINQEENIANTITGVVPFWRSTDGATLVTLPEKAVYSPSASLYSQKLTVPVDFSQNYENPPTEAALRAAAQAYVNNGSFGVPKVSIDVSFVDLRGTQGYDDAIELETVHLCDTVKVQFVPMGINTTAKVVKCVYDVLGEAYNQITVGSIRSNLAQTLTDQNSRTRLSDPDKPQPRRHHG
jgi:phage minor structural protein